MLVLHFYHGLQRIQTIEKEVWIHLLFQQFKLCGKIICFCLFQFHADQLCDMMLVKQVEEKIDSQIDDKPAELVHQHHGLKMICRDQQLVYHD